MRWIRLALWVVPVVLIAAVLTVIAEATIPNWTLLGNWGTMWTIPAFFIGSRAERELQGVTGGAAAMALIYAVLIWSTGGPGRMLQPSLIGIWMALALAGGAAAGLLGFWWRTRPHRMHSWAAAGLAGLLTAEGINFLIQLPTGRLLGVAELLAGLAAVPVLERNRPLAALGYLRQLLITAAALAAYLVLDTVFVRLLLVL
jgi:hypothetical protein